MSNKKKKHVKPQVAAFVYTSVCCGARANKEAVRRKPEDIKENKFSECSLGHWHCGQCGNNCKVTRSRVKEENHGDSGTGTETNTAGA